MLQLVFFGSDEIALPALERLVTAHTGAVALRAVYSQPDRPSGRGRKIQPNAVVSWARARQVPVFQPEVLDDTALEQFNALGCDLALVMAYGHILKKTWLAAPPRGFFNLHASLLPRLRGATPIEGAIVGGLRESGVTLQRVVPRLDAGPVVGAETVPLDDTDTRGSLRRKIAAACAPLLDRALPGLLSGTAAEVPQDEAAVTFTRKITREDAALDFSAPAWEIAARVRALSPWPGVTFPWRDGVSLKIGEAVAETNGTAENATPGTLLSADGAGVRIATGAGVLVVRQLQKPGGTMLPVAAFLAGFPLERGTVLESRPMAPLVRGGQPFPRKV